ncbi:CHC2 zinc finger domain-containing protein [Chitinophaga sp.]|uniref:CHC2 zinc finger domain-containing protein n=1 Tax=Chitinophaga sp. TaxID=1869181 RepID=UPI002BF5A08E|nr:CHC2 zinc finger domain-containing protein [Chitinophaga sp.]HWV64762.1 CHC2 zinc finger domain-containing protein [Chitinophaga sp.]
MGTRKISIEQAKQMDLVDYLASLGHYPDLKKARNSDHWYLSPLRTEKTPSFKVNRKLNMWFDHGLGQGGTIIDFGILFHRCTIPELLEKLQVSFSFTRRLYPSPASKRLLVKGKLSFSPTTLSVPRRFSVTWNNDAYQIK